MVNTIAVFEKSPSPSGRAAGIITNSGGFSVIQTDLCLKAGIEVPRFSRETIEALQSLIPPAGTSLGNPLDAWPIYYKTSSSGNIADIIRIVASDGNIHSLVFQFDQFRYLRRVLGDRIDRFMERLTALVVEGFRYARESAGKPVLACISLDPYLEDEQERRHNLMLKKAFQSKGFPVFSNLEGAIKALSNLCGYAQRSERGAKPCDRPGVL
jgi:acyl-CoA synthetase (NDP forming)